MSSFFRGRQVLVLSSVDWDATWQRHHALTRMMQEAGADVFFVENTGFRGLQWGDLGRVYRRLCRMFRPAPRGRARHIVAPMTLPPTTSLFRTLNAVYFLPLLLSRLRRMGLRKDPVVFAYLPTTTTLAVLDALAPSLVVYDCVDNFHGHPSPPADLDRTEAALLGRAACVLTTSTYLHERLRGRHPRVLEVHHGVSEDFFLPPSPAPPVYRRFCYFGTVWSAVDFRALRALAEAGFEVTLLGPVKEPPPPLPPSVRFLPPLPHAQLPSALSGYDALLLPYADTPYNKGVVPAKLYECLATGKPVLASPLASLKPYEDLLYIAAAPADFARVAQRLSKTEDAARARGRIAAARAHTTAAQFRLVEDALREAFAAREPVSAAPARRSASRAWAENFLRGFTWIAFFFALARMMTLFTQFIAAHYLGPENYGRAHLMIAVASIIQFLPILGFPLALARHGALEETDAGRRRVVSSILIAFGLWLVFSAALLRIGAPHLAPWTGLADADWGLTALYAFSTAAYLAVASALQGLARFRERGQVEALYGCASILALALLLLGGQRSFQALILAFILGLWSASLHGLWLLRPYLRLELDRTALREALPFAVLGALNVLATAFTQAPGRITAFHYRSAWDAGVYSVYFTASAQIALALSFMASTVLVPLTSQAAGQREAWATLRRRTAQAIVVLVPFFAACIAATLLLLRRSYPFRWDWLFLFAVSGALILVHGVFAAVFATRDLRGLLTSVAGALAAGGGNLLLNLWLTPRFGLSGAAAALMLGYVLGLGWYLLRVPAEER